MDELITDLRYALRQIRRRPIFTVVAALSLAIGVGANTAMFSAVNVLLFRPVSGVDDVTRVVEVGRSTQGRGFDTFSYPDYLDWSKSAAFEETSAFEYTVFSFATEEGGQRVNGIEVEPGYFRVLGLQPGLGRFFTDEEDAPGTRATVAVLGYRFWRDRLGGDPDILGRTIEVNRERFTVIGVMPPSFSGHDAIFEPAIFLPFRASPFLGGGDGQIWERRGSSWHQALARLAPGASIEEADAQVKAVYAALAQEYPTTNKDRSGSVVPLGSLPGPTRPYVGAFLGVLMAMVALILVVTCTNVAGMFLARATGREREIAVRLALGAGRRRLVRQLLVEALTVFVIGGAVGGLLGAWLLGLVPIGALPIPIEVHLDLSPDPIVLGFATAATLLTGIVFGLLPALNATRLELVSSLKDDGASRRAGGGRLRRLFVTAQVGVSLVLLVAAGLFARSLQRAARVDVGFDPTGTYMTQVNLDLEGYDDQEQALLLLDRIRARVAEIPGVTSAALSIDLPLDLGSHGTVAYPEGWSDDDRIGIDNNVVTPDYFRTLRIPMYTGRDFTDDDRADSEPVVIVTQEFVDAVWPDQEVLGRRLRISGDTEARTIIGVVADTKNQLVTDQPKPFVYMPLAQRYRGSTRVVVQSAEGMASVAPALRAAILEVDPSLALTPVVSLESYTGLGVLPQRIAAGLSSALGFLALLLSGIGVYGVVALAVTQRTREIGIRMALGARRGSVLAMIVRSGLVLCLPGIAVGAVLALGLGRALRSMLLGLSPADPVTIVGVAAALLAVVAVASLVPGRKAAGVQPVVALRSE